MQTEEIIQKLDNIQGFFNTSTASLTEEDAHFAPVEGTFTTAQQVAHVAHTVDWFIEGAFRPEGFNMDFASHDEALKSIQSLEDARAWLARSFDQARATLRCKSPEELAQPLPEGPVMGGAPRFAIVSGIDDHTAHHRGALSVYARLRKHVPPMPYMEM